MSKFRGQVRHAQIKMKKMVNGHERREREGERENKRNLEVSNAE